jgi:hypothetical protein
MFYIITFKKNNFIKVDVPVRPIKKQHETPKSKILDFIEYRGTFMKPGLYLSDIIFTLLPHKKASSNFIEI